MNILRPRLALALTLLLPLLSLSAITGCPFSAETFHRNCTKVADCSDGNPCTDDKCTAGICENPFTAVQKACGSSGPDAGSAQTPGVCDGKGKCVECVTSADCAGDPQKPICDRADHTCVSCLDGVMNGEETDVDCGGPDCGACQGHTCD